MNKKKVLIIVLLVIMVFAYDLIPIDIIPDILAGFGQIDDVGITLAGIAGIIATILSGKKAMEEQNTDANGAEGSFREL